MKKMFVSILLGGAVLSMMACGSSIDLNVTDVIEDENTQTVETEEVAELTAEVDTGNEDDTNDSYETEATIEASDESYEELTYEESLEESFEVVVTFRNDYLLQQHYEKHGMEMGYQSAEEYQYGAIAVVNNPASLHKLEAEDGDDVYYLESTDEFVVVSTDGYIRTYFIPDDGIEYYNRQ